jgi:hypothetical protein
MLVGSWFVDFYAWKLLPAAAAPPVVEFFEGNPLLFAVF